MDTNKTKPEKISKNGLDILDTPLIFSDTGSSAIIYKNKSALKNIKSPRCGMDISRYIGSDAAAKYRTLLSAGTPDIFRLDIKGVYKYALAFLYDRGGTVVTSWIFIKYLQAGIQNPFLNNAFFCPVQLSGEIIPLIRELDVDGMRVSYNGQPRLCRAEEYIGNVMNMLLGDGGAECSVFDLYKTVELFRAALNNVFAKLGYRLDVNISSIRPKCVFVRDFGKAAAALFQMIYISLNISRDKSLYVKFHTDIENSMCADITFTIDDKIKPAEKTDISGMAALFPSEILNITTFRHITEQLGWRVSCEYRDQSHSNFVIKILIPGTESVQSLNAPFATSIIEKYMKETVTTLVSFLGAPV